MSKFVMLGMSEEHARFMYELVKKEIDTIDVVMTKECYANMKRDIDEWLQSRRKIAEETKDLLTWVF